MVDGVPENGAGDGAEPEPEAGAAEVEGWVVAARLNRANEGGVPAEREGRVGVPAANRTRQGGIVVGVVCVV